jgi:rod shape-determining protein MreD
MELRYIKYFLILVILLFAQILVLNNINLSGFINPYLYILFILWLPFELKDWIVLLLGFGLGLTIDMFMSTPGIHTSATLFLAFSRKYVLYYMKPRDGYDANTSPSLKTMGISWYVTYAAILISLHHLFYFFVEIFRISDILYVISRAIASIIVTFVLTMIIEFFFSGNEERR